MKLKEFENQKVDLCWFSEGICKEVIERNKTRKQLAFKKQQLKNSTHKTGVLVFLVTGSHNY